MKRFKERLAFASLLFALAMAPAAWSDDWTQWRGPQRDGVAHGSPPLIDELPETGLPPAWISEDEIPSAGGGGWGSPVVAGGRVYLFAHTKTKVTEGALPPVRFPGLTEERRASMTEEEIADYQRKQREERKQRNKNFRFDEWIYCLDAQTGRTLWKNQRQSVFTGMPQSGTPLVADGRVYILGAGLIARCVDAETGEDLWAVQLPGEFDEEHLHSSFALAEGVAVVLAKRLFGLDGRTGELRWTGSEEKTHGLYSSPVVWPKDGRELVVVNVNGGQTLCVDPQTGGEVWRVPSEAGHSTPVIAGDRLITYGSSRKGGLRCFDLSQDPPELLWKYQRVADSGSSPVAFQGKVFVQGDRRLACVDLESGDAVWSTMLDLEQPRYTSLAAADDQVFYTFEGVLSFAADSDRFQELFNGKIDNSGLLADEATFRRMLKIDELETTAEGQKEAEQLWRQTFNQKSPLACTSPALADGRLYLRTRTGVICYDLRK